MTDPFEALRQIGDMLREETRAIRRSTAKMKAEAFQRRECGLALPRERDNNISLDDEL